MVQVLIPAREIPYGGWFIKRTGTNAYLRLSDSSVKYHKLNLNRVYGVSLTGNMTSVDQNTLVQPSTYEAYFRNVLATEEWERTVGIKND